MYDSGVDTAKDAAESLLHDGDLLLKEKDLFFELFGSTYKARQHTKPNHAQHEDHEIAQSGPFSRK